MTLNKQILLGALIGIGFGILFQILGLDYLLIADWKVEHLVQLADLVGNLFIKILKMILIPLIFTSIAAGISNLKAHAQMDHIWKLSLCYFVCTTALATSLGLVLVNLVKPGVGLQIDLLANSEHKELAHSLSQNQLSLGEFIQHFLSSLFMNPIEAMATNQVLPTVIFSIFFGVSLVKGGRNLFTVQNLLNEGYKIVMTIVGWIMHLAPLGIMGLLIKLIASQSLHIFTQLAVFISMVLGALAIHGLITLPLLLFLITRISPFYFFTRVKEALITALSTSSSSATLPITLRCVERNLQVNQDVAGFVLPLGSTINMDGTALYEAAAAIFIANIMGIELGHLQQLVIFLMAMIAAIGAPGIPSAGMVTMVMVLQAVGLPTEAIAILLPIDRLLDTFRTMVNVEGDAIGSLIVNHYTQGATPFRPQTHNEILTQGQGQKMEASLLPQVDSPFAVPSSDSDPVTEEAPKATPEDSKQDPNNPPSNP